MSSAWNGQSVNISIVQCLCRSKSVVWWAWTKWLSYCNSHQGWEAWIQKYDMKGREPRLSRSIHQRADKRMTPSFPLILKESSRGMSGWQYSLNCVVSPPVTLLSQSHSFSAFAILSLFWMSRDFFFPFVTAGWEVKVVKGYYRCDEPKLFRFHGALET